MSTSLTTAPHVAQSRDSPFPRRTGYALAGTGLTVAAVALAVARDTGVGSVLLFAVLPDVALLLALGRAHQPGQLPARAVPAYNLLHRPSPPVTLALASLAGLVSTYWLVAGLSWLAHICFDRACGYGLRTADGWQRG